MGVCERERVCVCVCVRERERVPVLECLVPEVILTLS